MSGEAKKASARKREILDQRRTKIGSSLSYALWRDDVQLAELVVQKGKPWVNMGTSIKGTLYCTI